MLALQQLFLLVVLGSLVYLVTNALITGSVWVKGARDGWWSTQWAHKRSRSDEAAAYWGFVLFYGSCFCVLLYLVSQEHA